VLAGTDDEWICLLERADQTCHVRWTLVNPPQHRVCSMAATDQVLVAGYEDGAMRIFRMDTSVL
jgi:hypothetical protein